MFLLLFCFLFIGQFLPNSNYHVNGVPMPTKEQYREQQVDLRNRIQETVQEVIPLEARDFYDNLTRSDKEVLSRVLTKAPNYNSVGEVLTDLRNGSSTLYDKAVQMVTGIRQTVAQLSPKAREYIDQSTEQLQTAMGKPFSLDLVKTEANELVQRFRGLEPDAKEELRSAFPMVATVVDNSIVQTLASGLLGIQTD